MTFDSLLNFLSLLNKNEELNTDIEALSNPSKILNKEFWDLNDL